MIFSFEKLDLAKADILLRTTTEDLSKASQKSFIEESISPAEEGEGDKIRVNPLNGIFIAPELHWNLITKRLGKKYVPQTHPAGKLMETEMGLKNVFPPKTIERDFLKKSGATSFCKAEIKFKPNLLSKSEAIYNLNALKEQANKTDVWAKPLKDWLESQNVPGFFYFVEFEIFCVFDFDKYWKARKGIKPKIGNSPPPNLDGIKEEALIQLNNKAKELLQKEAKELAEWAIQYVTKEEVFDDLCNAIDVVCEVGSAGKESTPTQGQAPVSKETSVEKESSPATAIEVGSAGKESTPTQGQAPASALSPKHRILIYKPSKLRIEVEIDNKKVPGNESGEIEMPIMLSPASGEVKINLSEKINVRITVKNYVTEQSILVDKNLKVVIKSLYFKEKTITFDEDPLPEGIDRWPLSKNKEFRSIKSKWKTLTPDINKITSNIEKLVEYPVSFDLVRSFGDDVSGDIVQYCQTQANVKFDFPKISFSVTRPYLPRKGEQFDIKFDVKCESNSGLDYPIPVKVVCHYGENFSTVKPVSDAEKKVITEELDLIVNQTKPVSEGNNESKKSNEAIFTLMAGKASFPGYYNTAYFEFFVGEYKKAVETWRMNITILPNLLDTLVAGGTFLLGLFSVAYPAIFPAITAGISIANLEIIPATIYLGYRVLNWSKTTA